MGYRCYGGPRSDATSNVSWIPELMCYEICEYELCFHDNILLRECKIVPPISLRERILMADHEGHPAVVHMRD